MFKMCVQGQGYTFNYRVFDLYNGLGYLISYWAELLYEKVGSFYQAVNTSKPMYSEILKSNPMLLRTGNR